MNTNLKFNKRYVFEERLGYMEVSSVGGKLFAYSPKLDKFLPFTRFNKGELCVDNVPSLAVQHKVKIVKKSIFLKLMNKLFNRFI